MKRMRFSISTGASWLAVLAGVAAAALVAGLYLFRLDGLVPAGSGELYTIQSLQSLSGILDNPLLLPYKLVAAGLLQLSGDPLLMVRLASAAVGLANAGLFFLLARRWYGTLNAVGATALFASSSWLLHTGRYGAAYGLLILAVLALLNLAAWTNNAKPSGRLPIAYTAVAGLTLFVPGGIWFIIAATFMTRKALAGHFAKASAPQKLAATGIAVASLAGIALTLVRDLTLTRQWLGLPDVLPEFIDIAKQAALSVSSFVLRGPATSETWLAHTPLLDVASIAFLLLGALFYIKHLGNSRTRLLLSYIVIGVSLVALHGASALGYLVPVAYLVLAGGLAFFLHRWKKVFPRNPIAQGVGLAAVGVLLLCAASFHVQRYFIAWRHSPNTVKAYHQANPENAQVPYLIQ